MRQEIIKSNGKLIERLITKNIMKTFIGVLILFSIANCTYDKSLIYKKNYQPGKSSLLKFNGFYYDGYKSIISSEGPSNFIYPIFFYNDGSVIFMGAIKDTFQLRKNISENPKAIWGYWGNYKISNDTISIETIGSYGGSFHHVRVIRIGVIKKDSICFFQKLDRKGNAEKLDEIIHFKNCEAKPDSTENWTRTKRKYK